MSSVIKCVNNISFKTVKNWQCFQPSLHMIGWCASVRQFRTWPTLVSSVSKLILFLHAVSYSSANHKICMFTTFRGTQNILQISKVSSNKISKHELKDLQRNLSWKYFKVKLILIDENLKNGVLHLYRMHFINVRFKITHSLRHKFNNLIDLPWIHIYNS